MKNFYLLILSFVVFFNNYSFAEMKLEVSKNEFEGTTNNFLMSDFINPNTPLSFPYDKSQSALILQCKGSIPYVYFDEVNLVGGETGDGYDTYTIKLKAKEKFYEVMATQDFGSNKVAFNFLPTDKDTVTTLMKENDEVWIQFNHYQDGKRFYKYDTRGTLDLFSKHCY